MVVPWTTRLHNFLLSVQVFGCSYLEYTYKGEFWLKFINSIDSILGCPATFLVVPGAQTTKILNTGFISLTAMGATASIVTRVKIDKTISNINQSLT